MGSRIHSSLKYRDTLGCIHQVIQLNKRDVPQEKKFSPYLPPCCSALAPRSDSSYRDMMKRQIVDSGAFKEFLKTHAQERVSNMPSVKQLLLLLFSR